MVYGAVVSRDESVGDVTAEPKQEKRVNQVREGKQCSERRVGGSRVLRMYLYK